MAHDDDPLDDALRDAFAASPSIEPSLAAVVSVGTARRRKRRLIGAGTIAVAVIGVAALAVAAAGLGNGHKAGVAVEPPDSTTTTSSSEPTSSTTMPSATTTVSLPGLSPGPPDSGTVPAGVASTSIPPETSTTEAFCPFDPGAPPEPLPSNIVGTAKDLQATIVFDQPTVREGATVGVTTTFTNPLDGYLGIGYSYNGWAYWSDEINGVMPISARPDLDPFNNKCHWVWEIPPHTTVSARGTFDSSGFPPQTYEFFAAVEADMSPDPVLAEAFSGPRGIITVLPAPTATTTAPPPTTTTTP